MSGKVAGTVRTEDSREQVLVLIIIIDTAKEGEEFPVRNRVITSHLRILVRGKRILNLTEVCGIPETPLGVRTGSVKLHAPTPLLDGSTD